MLSSGYCLRDAGGREVAAPLQPFAQTSSEPSPLMPAELIQGITIIYCNQFTVPAANPLNPQGNYGAHKEGDAVRSQNHGFTSGHRAGHAQTGKARASKT